MAVYSDSIPVYPKDLIEKIQTPGLFFDYSDYTNVLCKYKDSFYLTYKEGVPYCFIHANIKKSETFEDPKLRQLTTSKGETLFAIYDKNNKDFDWLIAPRNFDSFSCFYVDYDTFKRKIPTLPTVVLKWFLSNEVSQQTMKTWISHYNSERYHLYDSEVNRESGWLTKLSKEEKWSFIEKVSESVSFNIVTLRNDKAIIYSYYNKTVSNLPNNQECTLEYFINNYTKQLDRWWIEVSKR